MATIKSEAEILVVVIILLASFKSHRQILGLKEIERSLIQNTSPKFIPKMQSLIFIVLLQMF